MLLPEQVLLILGTHSGQHVVSVHDDVNKGVDNTYQRPMPARVVLGGPPGYHRHHRVMVQVEEGDLTILLADDEEDRVEELGHLR